MKQRKMRADHEKERKKEEREVAKSESIENIESFSISEHITLPL